MRISDWSSDVCSSDLGFFENRISGLRENRNRARSRFGKCDQRCGIVGSNRRPGLHNGISLRGMAVKIQARQPIEFRTGRRDNVELLAQRLRALCVILDIRDRRSKEHTSELQSLMRISNAVFCLKKKKSRLN